MCIYGIARFRCLITGCYALNLPPQKTPMSYEETKERNRSRVYFRTTMDIGMGIFYTIIGSLILCFKSFANIAIPPIFAYIVGGMMAIGGLFRLYRGIMALMPEKQVND